MQQTRLRLAYSNQCDRSTQNYDASSNSTRAPFSTPSTFDQKMEKLRIHKPRLAAAIAALINDAVARCPRR